MAGDVTEALLALVQKGPAWTRSLESVMRSLFAACAIELGRVQGRLDQAQLELRSPATATETIADWEEMLGLPSECTPIAATLDERRAEALRRWTRRGQWAPHVGLQFMVDRIVELGYAEADIYPRRFHFRPFTCGSRCGDQLFGTGYGWLLVYQFDVISQDEETDDRVICELRNRYAHASLGLEFAFPLVDWSDGTFTRSGTATAKHPRTEIETSLAANEMSTVYYGV